MRKPGCYKCAQHQTRNRYLKSWIARELRTRMHNAAYIHHYIKQLEEGRKLP
ncbi:MAG: hypothetical protein WC736_15195 [Gallionella sp.]|jgi:hypothetical protein